MVQFGYVTLTLFMSFILLFTYNLALKKIGESKRKRIKRTAIAGIGLLAWFVYVYFITRSGILQNYDLPPRFPIFLVIPPFIFTAIVLYKNRRSKIFAAIPKSWSIAYQSFRIIIESLFVATVTLGILHPEVTFEGYNYDILFGASSFLILFLVFVKKAVSEKVALIWNYLGLIVIAFIIFLFTTTTYFPSLWGSTTSLASEDMISFPFVLVPAFLMPSAVFVHIFSIMQMQKK
mgnify:CR=1 FL=1